MQRLFCEHKIRTVESLDGIWQLTALDTMHTTLPVGVPGVWDRIPQLSNYRGKAVYERQVSLENAGNYLLEFGGVSHTAHVFWDDMEIGSHYNAFTGFSLLLKSVPAGDHILRVIVDDSFSDVSCLHIPNDYYTYGGISRPVEIQKVGAAYIQHVSFHAENTQDGYTAYVRTVIHAIESLPESTLALSLAGTSCTLPVPALAPGTEAAVDAVLPVTDVLPWDIRDAHLYSLAAILICEGQPLDDLIDRVAFRTLSIADEDLLLNGKKIQLRGFNRHEDHGQFGVSLPVEAMLDDLQLVMDLGGNAIRTCHYPNDPRFLDLCDELGILVWEEHHARALPDEIFFSETFMRQSMACTREMIQQHGNHPSIVIWGLLNECESATPQGRNIYAKQIQLLRSLDPTRPVSFASCRHFTDCCLDLVDIVSFNIYPQWYVAEPVQDYLDRLVAWMDDNGAAGKPILITEIGAGAIAGFHDPLHHSKWSEERQADILAEQLNAVLHHPRLSGMFLWQFADVRVSEEWSMRRPKSMNNKGIVDMYRNPKLAYVTVRDLYHKP
ncbi:MAG: beta-glucuronidase [Clostridia bacterium]|nr:beta-glucuronidase [Clostridia bacterium]